MEPELNRRTLASDGAGFVPGYPQSMLDILGPNNIAAVHGPLHRAMRGAMLALTRPHMIRAALLPKIDAFMRAHLHGWAGRRVDIQEMTKEVWYTYTDTLGRSCCCFTPSSCLALLPLCSFWCYASLLAPELWGKIEEGKKNTLRKKGSNSVGPTVERCQIYLDYIAFQWPNCHSCWHWFGNKPNLTESGMGHNSLFLQHLPAPFLHLPSDPERQRHRPTRQNDGAPWKPRNSSTVEKGLRAKGGIFPILSSLSQKGNLWLSRTCTALLDRQKFMSRRKGQTGGKGKPFPPLSIYTFQSAQQTLHAPSSPSHVSMQKKHLAGCWIPYLFHSVAWQLIITESHIICLCFFFSSDGFALSSQADCWHLCWPTVWCPKGGAVHPCTWHLLPANQHPRNQLQQRAPGTVRYLHTWKHQKEKSDLNWAL